MIIVSSLKTANQQMVPTNDCKLLEEGKSVDAPTADSMLPIHGEVENRVDDPSPVAEDGQTDHSTQLSC